MKIRLISVYEDMAKIETEWRNLCKNSGDNNIFISWEWCALWWKHFGENKKLIVLVVEEKDEIIGIAPLMIIKGNFLTLGKPVIRFLGDPIISADYMDFLIVRNHEKVLHLIFEFLKERKDWGLIELKRIPESSPNLHIIEEVVKNLNSPNLIRVDCVSPCLKTEGAWDDYYKSLSKGFKRGIASCLSKLSRSGKISFENYNGDRLDLYLNWLYEMHREREVFKTGRSIFEEKSNRDFYSDLTLAIEKQGWLDISVLKIKDKIISLIYGLKYSGVFYCWLQAFDPEYRKYSPGKLHIKKLIEDCFTGNYKKFDFMIGDEPYKLHWAKDSYKNYEIKIYRNSLLQKSDYLKIKLREFLRDVKNKYSLLGKLWIKLSKIKF